MGLMNTKRSLAFVLSFALGWTVLTASAQERMQYSDKLSISTRMFLDEMAGDASESVSPVLNTGRQHHPRLLGEVERHIASPEFIDGRPYVAAFVRVSGDGDIGALEKLGVIIETRFQHGLLTTMIPVDGIDAIAALDGVTRIEVSPVLHVATDLARKATRVDDVLTRSAAAVAVNVPKGYDGTGVLLGVIDRGIDFQHIAFKDKDGATRIKRAYVYNGKGINYYGVGELPNDGITNTDHGSHTSAIAGGSSVIVDGTDVTVTDDHASATYGGMAPAADLFLCGINGMTATRIANAFNKICNYADSMAMPVVVSNSYGDYVYNRDGGGAQGEIVAQLFGDSHPGRICVFATANNAGHSGGAPGGVYVCGSASSQSPLGSIVCSSPEVTAAGWQYYRGEYIADAFTRATDATGIALTIHVLDVATGDIVNSYDFLSADGNSSVTLGDYFTGYRSNTESPDNAVVRVYFDYMTGKNRKQALVYTPYGLISSDYTLAVEVSPIGGSSDVIDMWTCGNYTYFDNHLATMGHDWALGTDDMSVFGNACYPEVISVGSYVTRAREGSNSVGDISDYSCYALEGMGPLGTMHPWIAAPGEDIVSAFNRNVNRSYYDDVVVNNPTDMYGLMSGTSMSTPMVAGIVALWMQAAAECGKQLTHSEVKQIMKETAIRDSWVTSGPHSTHFGNGKINALGGIEYILREYGGVHTYQMGDVNHNGEVDIEDVTVLIEYVLGLTDDICTTCAHVSVGDDPISVSDVSALIDMVLYGM